MVPKANEQGIRPPPHTGRALLLPEGRVRGGGGVGGEGEARAQGEGEAREKGVGVPAVGHKHQRGSPER